MFTCPCVVSTPRRSPGASSVASSRTAPRQRAPARAAVSQLVLLRGRDRRAFFLEQRPDVAFAAILVRDALVHPLGTRFSEEVVIEELVHVDSPVLHVVAIAEAVPL